MAEKSIPELKKLLGDKHPTHKKSQWQEAQILIFLLGLISIALKSKPELHWLNSVNYFPYSTVLWNSRKFLQYTRLKYCKILKDICEYYVIYSLQKLKKNVWGEYQVVTILRSNIPKSNFYCNQETGSPNHPLFL